jgi:hypothetical protein
MRDPSPAVQASPAPPGQSRRLRTAAFILLLAGTALYYARFIYGCSFTMDGTRYFCLMDDTMISMRYARNLASGNGLVWNVGEAPVEGFTNPAWVLVMTAAHMLPLPAAQTGLCVQIIAALCLLANLWVIRSLSQRLAPDRLLPAWTAMGLCVVFLPLTFAVPAGLEQCLAILLVDWALLEALKGLDRERMNPRVYVIMAAALWVRMDLLIPFLAVWILLALWDAPHRGAHLRMGAMAMGISLGLQTIARMAYFGEWLPNTYYAKLTGFPLVPRLIRGAADLAAFAWSMNPILVLLPLVVLKPWRSLRIGLPAAILAGQAAYHVYVGGDIVYSRFLLTAMPLFFLLLGLTFQKILDACDRSPRRKLFRAGLYALLPVVAMVYSGIQDLRTARLWLGDAHELGRHSMAYYNESHVRRSLLVNQLILPGARVAVTWAGVQGYFINGNIVDLLGLCDPIIAHRPAHVPEGPRRWAAFYPGHMKWDHAHSIGTLRPDLVIEFWGESRDVAPYLERDYQLVRRAETPLWIRRDSALIRRENLGLSPR